MVIAGPGLSVAGAIGRGLAVRLGVGLGVGLGLAVEMGDGVASRVLLGLAAGLVVAELEQATTASSKERIEPVRARRPVRTLSTPMIDVAVASLTPHPPRLWCGRRAPLGRRPILSLGTARRDHHARSLPVDLRNNNVPTEGT